MTKCEVFGVYLIDFKINEGGELSNKHYGLVLTKMSSSDKTRVYIILCKLIDEFSKFNALPFYLHKNFYTLDKHFLLLR